MTHGEQMSLMICIYKAERKTSVSKTKINAQELFFDILKERAETGRIYIMNIGPL